MIVVLFVSLRQELNTIPSLRYIFWLIEPVVLGLTSVIHTEPLTRGAAVPHVAELELTERYVESHYAELGKMLGLLSSM